MREADRRNSNIKLQGLQILELLERNYRISVFKRIKDIKEKLKARKCTKQYIKRWIDLKKKL